MSEPNPRDPRYRIDQSLPVGTRVRLVTKFENGWLIERYGPDPIGTVEAIDDMIFLHCLPIRLPDREIPHADGRGVDRVPGDILQWEEDQLIPEWDWPPADLTRENVERWLKS